MTSETRAVLSLGSNLGDREVTIREAVADIAALQGVTVDAASGLVQTAALKTSGIDEFAPPYLNAVLRVTTSLSAPDLLASVAAIELSHGRVREERWGDRTLDIDIVTYGDLRLIKAEFEELMQLSMAAGTIKHSIPYEKYVDEQFARGAHPATIPL